MDYTKMSSGLINKAYNKPINTLTSFAGTHTRRAASPLCPTCLRPLLKSYVSKGSDLKIFIIVIVLCLTACTSMENEQYQNEKMEFAQPEYDTGV